MVRSPILLLLATVLLVPSTSADPTCLPAEACIDHVETYEETYRSVQRPVAAAHAAATVAFDEVVDAALAAYKENVTPATGACPGLYEALGISCS